MQNILIRIPGQLFELSSAHKNEQKTVNDHQFCSFSWKTNWTKSVFI